MLTRRLALGALLVFTLAARAEDPPKPDAGDKPPADAKPAPDAPKPDDADKPAEPSKPSSVLNPNAGKPTMHSVGQVVIKVTKVDGSTVSTKVAEMERNTNTPATGKRSRGAGQLHPVQKDKDYDLASDYKVRWHDLPKKADGTTKYTDKEYQALLEPKGTPGYKADSGDLKSGQTVRLYLSKGSAKDDKVVVTTVMILADAPKGSDTTSDTPKKKKKDKQ
jgi:hypothetical protein